MLRLGGNKLDHRLGGGELPCAAEGHQHRAGADRRVKAFGKAALRAAVEVRRKGFIVIGETAGDIFRLQGRRRRCDRDVLLRAVRIQEIAADVHNRLSVPVHDEASFLLHFRHDRRLQILFLRKAQEGLRVLRRHDHGHALLRLADRKLGAVKAFVLLRYCVQIDDEAVREFADRDRHAARAEVVAALDEFRCLRPAEQALEFSFLGGVALLNFRAAVFHGMRRVGLRGACRTADAVAPRPAAEKQHDVSGRRALAPDVLRRRRCDDRADLHALRFVAGMVPFVDNAGRKADLIAVGGIACGRRRHDFPLWKLAGKCLFHRFQRVCRARQAHGPVDVGPSRKRIADGAADTGGRAAEGLDLGRVIVCFVLEKEEPRFLFAVHLGFDADRAGIDLLGFVKFVEAAVRFQVPDRQRRDVHEARGLRTAEFPPRFLIAVPGLLQERILKADRIDDGIEGRVAAVIGPVGVDHADLRDGRIAPLGEEIIAAEFEVVRVHGKAEPGGKCRQGFAIHFPEAVHHLHALRNGVARTDRFGLFERCLTGFNGVDHVLSDRRDLLFTEITVEDVDLCRLHERTLSLEDQLDALRRRVRALVELAGQVFHGKDRRAREADLFRSGIHLRLRKHGTDRIVEMRLVQSLRVVAVQQPQILKGFDPQKFPDLPGKCLRFAVLSRFFLHENAIDHSFSPLYFVTAARPRCPMSFR